MLVLQSGEDLRYDADKLAWLIKTIHKKCRRCLFVLSIGDRDYDTYENLYKAGARGVLFVLKLPTNRYIRSCIPIVLLPKE